MSRNLTKFRRLAGIHRDVAIAELQALVDRYLEAERHIPEYDRVAPAFIALLALCKEPPGNGMRIGITSDVSKSRVQKRREHWL